jgi:hypothetical protein
MTKSCNKQQGTYRGKAKIATTADAMIKAFISFYLQK